MKVLFNIILGLITLSAFCLDEDLDGLKFCRLVTIKITGKPDRIDNHCLTFEDGRMSDNLNTFYGKSSESFNYKLINKKIINIDEDEFSGYLTEDTFIVKVETEDLFKIVH